MDKLTKRNEDGSVGINAFRYYNYQDFQKLTTRLADYEDIGTIEEFKTLKDYKELYDVYRNIGSINEFRNLKNKKNVLPIVNITIDEEDMQKIVDEKIKEIELDIQEIRAKSIDEFAEELKQDYRFDSICRDDVSFYEYCKKIERIVEQLKAGGKNE